ncbi:MAG: YT521-B-like domain-containing protein [Linnemannia elongata]|nr:MAG: YT521-B-like domain-containing protein [Linnemannia elongata]
MLTTTSTASPSLSSSRSAHRSPADQLTAPSSSLPNTVRNNPTALPQTTTLSNMEALIGSLDLTRPTLHNTTTTTSSASSPVTEPLQITDPDLASELQDSTTSTNIKVEPEDPPTLTQAAKAPSPEVTVKQEPLNADDATKFLRQALQTSTPGLADPMEAGIGAHDPHYFVIRVSDESDFNDARRSNVWNTNPMYDKALRELYSPTSQVFLIFTVFMSGEFCGIAKMASEMMWVGERTIFDKSNLRQKFKLQWVACSRVSYDSVKELIHEPIYKIIRKNGYELPQDVGGGIHKLLIENQTEEEPQPTLALQEADSSTLDITATSFSQDMLMGEGDDAQERPTLHLDSLFKNTSDMDVDLPEPTTIDFQDKDKDEGEDNVKNDEDSSPMDLDSNPDTAADLIEIPSPKATILHSPRSRKRSLSCDENADLSMERAHADEEQKKSMEPTLERMDRKADDREEEEDGDEEMEMGEALSRRDVSPIRARSPKKLDSPPPSIPSKRWSPSRRRSPPPPQTRYSRGGSPPPPGSSSRYWSPPPPSLRRNRSPPPPSHYYQPPPYERSGSTASSSSGYQGFRSPPPFPQRSKDPRDRSSSTYVFHSGSAPKYRDRFINAPADPRLSTNRSASSSVVPQKRPYDDPSGSMEDDKGTVLSDAVDLPASVFPLADDDDDGMGDHFIPPPQPVNPSVAGASSSSSSPSAPGGPSSSSSTAPPVDPPPQITSITLVPAGMSKSRRKKMRKEALAKPLDF